MSLRPQFFGVTGRRQTSAYNEWLNGTIRHPWNHKSPGVLIHRWLLSFRESVRNRPEMTPKVHVAAKSR